MNLVIVCCQHTQIHAVFSQKRKNIMNNNIDNSEINNNTNNTNNWLKWLLAGTAGAITMLAGVIGGLQEAGTQLQAKIDAQPRTFSEKLKALVQN